ncbi:MAG: hypothetical protein JSU86_08855, partial [Phycisphaerales bacterium]
AMSGGIVLSRSAVRWFGVEYGPKWTQRLIQACCCTPLMAIGAAPLLEADSDVGVPVWLGLLVVAVFANWEKTLDKASGGEMSFGTALWTAFCGLFFTMIVGLVFDKEPDAFVLIGAGVAGAVSLVIQATSWWLPAQTTRAFKHLGVGDRLDAEGRGAAAPPGPPEAPAGPETQPPYTEAPDQQPVAGVSAPSEDEYASCDVPTPALTTEHPRLRWGVTRAFWGLVTFILIGGAIVTFLIPLVGKFEYHNVTGSIIACTGFASFIIFALRKTTPIKRDGFWRETVRPFMISLSMFGIGGTITGIAREWSHERICVYGPGHVIRCVLDEGQVALI